MVLECTGKFNDGYLSAVHHLERGARKVLISAPPQTLIALSSTASITAIAHGSNGVQRVMHYQLPRRWSKPSMTRLALNARHYDDPQLYWRSADAGSPPR
jgi:hypothetical protein